MTAEFTPVARGQHEQYFADWLEKREFRPTALIVPIVELNPLAVTVSFGYLDNAPFFPQGGIELDETIEQGAARELCEELGPRVSPESVVYTGFARFKEIQPEQRQRRGYKGILIYVCYAQIDPAQISPDMDEIVRYEIATETSLLDRVRASGDTSTARKTWQAFEIVKKLTSNE